MSNEHPNEKTLFNVASAIEEPELRLAYLEQVCGDDRTLRDRVLHLVQMGEEDPAFLEASPAGVVATMDAPQVFESIGSQIGPYKLREQIGEGGMGVVYVAEQTEPLKRKVALKIIKPEMASKDVVSRFEAERQALAMMDHPNIARVFDGGTTAQGHPYFVMELVRGVPITEYCDERRLSTEQRLKLFALVCRAVQHAHQKGVIHRDLKPSNIIVSKIDDAAVPKVIDFGVAKAISHKLTDQTVYTQHAQMIGTPLYMSPEQAELGVVDVDIRSDVYSLGVLLYEMLTSCTPFDSDTLKQVGFDEMRRIIKEDEPLKPSAKVSTLKAEELSTVSQHRGSDPRRLAASLVGELDWIVAKALEKDRNRRYQSASDLADDVERFLTDRPIEAKPPSMLYRAKKYTKRHAARLIPAAAVAVVLLLGLAIALVAAFRERAEKDQALHETARMLYVTRMQQAAPAWERKDYGELELLLRRTTPGEQDFESDFRDWEWRFLNNQVRRPFVKTPIPINAVSTGAWRPGGRELAVCIQDGEGNVSLELWSIGSKAPGRNVAHLIDMGWVTRVRWSRNGQRLAIGNYQGRVVVLSVPTGERLFDRNAFEDVTHVGSVKALDLSPSGDRIAVASDSGMYRLWSIDEGKLLVGATDESSPNVSCVAFSPDETKFAIASRFGRVRLFDRDGRTFGPNFEKIDLGSDNQIAWSPDGAKFAMTGVPGVAIYDPDDKTPVTTLPHRQAKSVCWISDSELASAGADHAVRLWDVPTGAETRCLFLDAWPPRLAGASSDGELLAIEAFGQLRVVRLSDLGALQPLTAEGEPTGYLRIRWSPSGQLLAAATNGTVVPGSRQPAIRVFDCYGGLVLEQAVGINSTIAWNDDAELFAADWRGDLHTLDIKKRQLSETRSLAKAEKDDGVVSAVNPRRRLSACWAPHRVASGDNKLQIVSLDSMDVVDQIEIAGGSVSGMQWSPDHRYLAVVGRAQEARLAILVYDADRRESRRRLLDHTAGRPRVCWDPTSSRLAVGRFDGSVQVFDAESLQPSEKLYGHRGPIWSIDWSPSASRIATGSDDGTVRIWDATQGDCVAAYHVPDQSRVLAVDWSPDGEKLAVGDDSGAIYLLDGG